MNRDLEVRWLGRLNFAEAFALQEEILGKKRENRLQPDELLLLEHESVYTIGRTTDQSSLLGEAHLPHPLFRINRGGQATYHGPGQLIGYPIVDLRNCGQDLHKYLRWVEQLVMDVLGQWQILGARRHGLTGVWIENQRKIASIGVGVRYWITMHGFALNVCGDLSPFDQIVPCGLSDVTMTSMARELGRTISVVDVARTFESLAFDRMGDLRLSNEMQPATAA